MITGSRVSAMMSKSFASLLPGRVMAVCLVCLLNTAQADVFDVTIHGEVEFNQINSGTLGMVNPGDLAVISFQVNEGNFVDSTNFPVRGYVIDETTFSMQIGAVTIGLQDPLMEVPLFVLRNDDPAVDGFFLGTEVDGFPNGVALDQTGAFGQFRSNFSVTYGNDPLSSLDIADAVGDYDFDGLTVFGFTIDDGPFNAAGLIFSDMSISAGTVIPEPTTVIPFIGLGIALANRRTRRSSNRIRHQ